jgi:hypothetical protein
MWSLPTWPVERTAVFAPAEAAFRSAGKKPPLDLFPICSLQWCRRLRGPFQQTRCQRSQRSIPLWFSFSSVLIADGAAGSMLHQLYIPAAERTPAVIDPVNAPLAVPVIPPTSPPMSAPGHLPFCASCPRRAVAAFQPASFPAESRRRDARPAESKYRALASMARRSKCETVSLLPNALATCMKFWAVRSVQPNSRFSHGSHSPCAVLRGDEFLPRIPSKIALWGLDIA